jgi:hypothetical protein
MNLLFSSPHPTSRAAFALLICWCLSPCSDRSIADEAKQNKSQNDSVVKVFINPKTGEWQRDQGQAKPKYWTEKGYHWLFLPSAHQERAPWEYSAGNFPMSGRFPVFILCVCRSAPDKD